MKKVLIIIIVAIVLGIGLSPVTSPVYANAAEDAARTACYIEHGYDPSSGLPDPWDNGKCNPDEQAINLLSNILNIIFFALGIASVIMIICGAVQFIMSRGDSKKVGDAKNIILYSIIGLVIAILAFAITNFVLNVLNGESTISASACKSQGKYLNLSGTACVSPGGSECPNQLVSATEWKCVP